MAGEKTERASPRRKQKAREKGDIFQSRELTSALGMAAGVLVMGSVAERFVMDWRMTYQYSLDLGIHRDMSVRDGAVVAEFARTTLTHAFIPLAMVLGMAFSAVLMVGLAQAGGLRFHAESLQPQFNRLSPATNIKNIFSTRAATRMLKSLIPAALVLVVATHILEQGILSLPVLSYAHVTVMFRSFYQMLLYASGILLGWSALDYLVEWRSWEQRLRMSKDEMRDEYKETEGSPQVRNRIRSIQRQMRRRRMQADVSRATVVIVNPTHYAVALEFDFETLDAPKVLAKGRNLMAQQIKDQARWAGVPIVENPPLARSLYRSVEPGQTIPPDLYAAVATILAFLYRQRVEEMMRQSAREQAKKSTPSTASHATPLRGLLSSLDIKNSNPSADEFGTVDAEDVAGEQP